MTVCVERQGQAAQSITVAVMTAAGTATGKSVCACRNLHLLSITFDSYNNDLSYNEQVICLSLLTSLNCRWNGLHWS